MKGKTTRELAEIVETGLGENLVWLHDQLNLLVRQRDPETLRRLQQLSEAHVASCHILSRAKA